MKTNNPALIADRTDKFITMSTSVLMPSLLVGLSLISLSGQAYAACIVDPSAWTVDSTLDCDNPRELDIVLGEKVRVVKSDVGIGTNLGARTQVLTSTLSNATIGADSHAHDATIGALELPVELGPGAFVDRGVRMIGGVFGSNAHFDTKAFVNGGRGIDVVRVGDNLVLGRRAELRIRTLGDNADIGADSLISESTDAGNNFKFGERSRWFSGGSIGDNVTIGRDVTIDGGINMGDGVTVGAFSSISFLVKIGDNANLGSGAVLETQSTVGANVLTDRGVVIGTGATVGDSVMLRRSVEVGDNALIGAGSIVSSGVIIPVGAEIPPNSFVDRNGSVSPRTPEVF